MSWGAERDRSDRYDWANRYELIERAFALWREGERALEYSPWHVPSVRAGHERAVAIGVDVLRRYTTMSDLVAAYYAPKFLDEEEFPAAWANESWVDYACRIAGAPQASRSIVEDASYFRRARELIQQATEGT